MNDGIDIDKHIDVDIDSNNVDINHDDWVNNDNGGMDLMGENSNKFKVFRIVCNCRFNKIYIMGPTQRGSRYHVYFLD